MSSLQVHICPSHGGSLSEDGNSLRLGGPPGLRLERFAEALNDRSSGLTYPVFDWNKEAIS